MREFINVATAETATLHISNGNTKCNVPYFSINPGDGFAVITGKTAKHRGKTVGNMPGTCHGVCSGCGTPGCCYALRDFLRFNNTNGKAWNDNTFLAMTGRLFKLLDSWFELNEPRYFRIHESGEFFNYGYFLDWMRFIEEHPDTRFYFYTKHDDYFIRYISTMGYLPDNCSGLISIWRDTVKNTMGMAEFIYDDGSDPEVKKIWHCPAVNPDGSKTGVTCKECKRCMFAQPGDKIAVYPH